MKGKRLLVILLAFVLAFSSLTACGLFGSNNNTEKNTENNSEDGGKQEAVTLTDKALAGDMLIDFRKGADSAVVFESDGWTNGDVFNVVWQKNNVKYENGKMLLSIVKEDKNAWLDDKEVTFPYTAGEARTQNYFGYGDYTVRMKPSANPGTASTFFVCTGPYDTKYVLDAEGNVVYNEDGTIKSEPNRHDEIDIEFLGKDTTKVQFNFFVNGKGGNEYMYDLGFDASKEFHDYGFRWEEDSITWFVDGKPVYKVTTDKTATAAANVRVVEELPYTPGRLLMSHWCGNERAYGWMGEYAGTTKDNGCEYEWIKTTSKGAPLNPEITTPGGETVVVPEIDWSKISAINPTFDSTEVYTVTNNGTTSNVKYSAVGGSTYINVEMDITAAAKQKNLLHLTLKNNAKTEVQVRVNVVDAELLAKGAQNSSTNKKATANGVEVRTDLEWGGSFIDIPAGETAEVVISFTGNVEKLQLMIDSSRNDAETRAGDVTVSDIKFTKDGEIVDENTVGEYKINPFDKIMKATVAVNVRDLPHKDGNKLGTLAKGEVVLVTGQCEQTKWYRIAYKDGKVGYVTREYLTAAAAGEYPAPSASNAIYINGKEYFFEKNDYVLKSDKNNNLNITYKDIVGATYKNISAYVAGISADFNKLTLKVKNNGSSDMKLRIDVNGSIPMCKDPDGGDMKASNLYATQDGNEVYTDLQWGGSQFTIAAGKTSTLEIYFDATKNVETLIIFIDSSDYLEADQGIKHSGNITLSGVAFGKGTIPSKPEEPEQPSEPEQPDTPVEPPVGETTKVEADLTFNSDTYTVEKDAENKTWAVTYANVPGAGYKVISAAIEAIDAGLNKFTVTVLNNSDTTAKVRIDILDANEKQINKSSTMNGEETFTDLTYGGSMFEVPSGQPVVLEVVFDAAKGAKVVNMFFDSHTWGDTGVYGGDLTLSDMAFIGVLQGENNGPIVSPGEDNEGGEGNEPEQPVEPEQPTNPTSGDLTTTINGTEVTFGGNVTDGYGVNANDTDNTVNVTYTNVVGNSYKNFWANVGTIAAGKDTFTVKITNPGTVDVKVRIDIESETQINANTTACNQSSKLDGKADGTYTDLEWGGSMFTIPAGKTVVAEVKFDSSKTPTNLKIFVDSHTYDDETTHAGNVTFSEFAFTGGVVEPENPDDGNEGGNENEGGETTTPEEVYATINDKEIKVDGNKDVYAVTKEDDDVNIAYSNLAANSWSNLCLWVKEVAAENNTFHIEITNNGEETVKIRIDLKDEADKLTNLSALMTAVEVSSAAHDSTYVEIEAGSTAIIEIKYDTEMETALLFLFIDSWMQDGETHAGNISLAGMEFKTVTPPVEEEEPENPTGKLVVNWANGAFGITDTTALQSEVKVNYTKQEAKEEWGVCASFAPAEDITGKDTFTLKVKNNGTTEAKFKIDLKNVVGEGDSKVETNLFKAVASVNSWYTAENEAFVSIGGGMEVVLKITFDASEKALTDIVISPALTTVNGDIVNLTFSDFAFTTEGTAEYVKFWGNTGYTIVGKGGAEYAQEVSIKYVFEGNAADSYVPCGVWVEDKLNGKNTCTFKIKNHKDTTVKLRFDVEGQGEGEVLTLAAQEEVFYTISYTDNAEVNAQQILLFVGPGETATNADITISNMKFYTVEAE